MFGLRGLRPDLEISGFETAFGEIAPRLVARGVDVTIYCRASAHSATMRPPRGDGVTLIYMPSPGGKNFSALISTGLAVLHALVFQCFDVWFFVNVGMGHHCMLARLSRRPVVMNVDGLDWTRAKWGPIARWYFRSAARAAVRFCSALVTDAEAMRVYYREQFGRDSTMIPYGADVEDSVAPELLAPLGVTARDYYLIVSRLVPENSLIPMLDGFRATRSARRLLVVGGANYDDAFHGRLREIARSDPRITLLGHVHDQALLRELWCNCFAYLHGHSVGGTNPALLRAMGYGSCVVALDTVFNREPLADTGLYFRESADLSSALEQLEREPSLVGSLRVRAQERVRVHYAWSRIADEYERLFRTAAGGRPD
jgi:glycosyltransferase involved in cell wall biosynthesis